jgi:hypothetical protein
MLTELPEPIELGEPAVERAGEDLLLDWRLQEV